MGVMRQLTCGDSAAMANSTVRSPIDGEFPVSRRWPGNQARVSTGCCQSGNWRRSPTISPHTGKRGNGHATTLFYFAFAASARLNAQRLLVAAMIAFLPAADSFRFGLETPSAAFFGRPSRWVAELGLETYGWFPLRYFPGGLE